MSLGTELGSPEFWDRLGQDPARLAAEVCHIDVANLDQTLQRHPALRAWVNATFEAARLFEERCKLAHTKARARALLTAKGVTDAHTGKAKTVQVLEAEVDTDEEVLKAAEALLTAGEKRGAMRAMADALEDRLQMLIQISAKQRAELREYS